jgi:hypothetical protein
MKRTEAPELTSIDTENADTRVASDRLSHVHAPTLHPPGAGCTPQLVWHTERSGQLAAEACGFRLVVLKRSAREELARFMVLRRQFGRGSLFALVSSGMEADVRRAMEAAEQQGCRFAGLDPDQFASGASVGRCS